MAEIEADLLFVRTRWYGGTVEFQLLMWWVVIYMNKEEMDLFFPQTNARKCVTASARSVRVFNCPAMLIVFLSPLLSLASKCIEHTRPLCVSLQIILSDIQKNECVCICACLCACESALKTKAVIMHWTIHFDLYWYIRAIIILSKAPALFNTFECQSCIEQIYCFP